MTPPEPDALNPIIHNYQLMGAFRCITGAFPVLTPAMLAKHGICQFAPQYFQAFTPLYSRGEGVELSPANVLALLRGWGGCRRVLGRLVDHGLLVSQLHCADLRGTDLQRSMLSRWDLTGCHFSHADLRGADLFGADLHRAHLVGTDLRGARAQQASLSQVHAEGSSWCRSDLRRAEFIGADLRRAEFEGANLGGAMMRDPCLWGAKLQGAGHASTLELVGNVQWCEHTTWPEGLAMPRSAPGGCDCASRTEAVELHEDRALPREQRLDCWEVSIPEPALWHFWVGLRPEERPAVVIQNWKNAGVTGVFVPKDPTQLPVLPSGNRRSLDDPEVHTALAASLAAGFTYR